MAKCPRCSSSIKSWDMQTRTCYACPVCQPLTTKGANVDVDAIGSDVVPFNSHCAREALHTRLAQGASSVTAKELKEELGRQGLATTGTKPVLAARLAILGAVGGGGQMVVSAPTIGAVLTAEEAAAEKAIAGENRAVEHVAELAPSQARRAGHAGKSTRKRSSRSDEDGAAGSAANRSKTAVMVVVKREVELEVKLEEPNHQETWENSTIPQLKEELTRLALPCTGRLKADLIQRLKDNSEAEKKELKLSDQPKQITAGASTTTARGPTTPRKRAVKVEVKVEQKQAVKVEVKVEPVAAVAPPAKKARVSDRLRATRS